MKRFIVSIGAVQTFLLGSGEVEAKLFVQALRMIGHDAEFGGSNNDPVNDYDVHVHFSLSEESGALFSISKSVGLETFLFPQINVDNVSEKAVGRIRAVDGLVDRYFVRSRAEAEVVRSLAANPRINVIPCFYMEPFVSESLRRVDEFWRASREGSYVLSFCDTLKLHELERLVVLADKLGKDVRCVVPRHQYYPGKQKHHSSIKVLPAVEFRSSEWYYAMRNCFAYVEPNEFLTTAMFEALSFGKPILAGSPDALVSCDNGLRGLIYGFDGPFLPEEPDYGRIKALLSRHHLVRTLYPIVGDVNV